MRNRQASGPHLPGHITFQQRLHAIQGVEAHAVLQEILNDEAAVRCKHYDEDQVDEPRVLLLLYLWRRWRKDVDPSQVLSKQVFDGAQFANALANQTCPPCLVGGGRGEGSAIYQATSGTLQ